MRIYDSFEGEAHASWIQLWVRTAHFSQVKWKFFDRAILRKYRAVVLAVRVWYGSRLILLHFYFEYAAPARKINKYLYRALWREYRDLLWECRALLWECRDLLWECRALLWECRALLWARLHFNLKFAVPMSARHIYIYILTGLFCGNIGLVI